MPKYSSEQLNEMAEQIDIVEYIGQTEEVHHHGQQYFCCCPFHNGDDTPSLCIYPETHTWYCYGCHTGRSIYDWIMLKDSLSFQEAVEKVSSLIGSPLDEGIESESIGVLKELKKCTEIHHKDAESRQILNWSSDYLYKYSDEDPQEWLDEGMTHEALKTYNIRIDKNKNRIVYPVWDSDGNFIGVKGRTRLSTYKEFGISKYMNYYKVGQLDYFQGFQQAYQEIKRLNSVIIFEGIKSCIKAYGWGIKNTVASETAALSDGQLKLLIKLGVSEVVIGWDSDQSIKKIISNPKIQILKRFVNLSIIKNVDNLLGDKESPVDQGENVFRKLYSLRIKL